MTKNLPVVVISQLITHVLDATLLAQTTHVAKNLPRRSHIQGNWTRAVFMTRNLLVVVLCTHLLKVS